MTNYDITDDVKRDVLAATDLVQLVSASTSLKKAGSAWKGLCPFHSEKTPSFHVHPQKGFYYCFGCGAKGDAITFVRETERLEYPEAVAYLARLAGITLPERRSGSRADRAKETRVSEAVALAARFFRDQLPSHPAAAALLARRGISPEEAREHGFGAAPDAWDALRSALSGRAPEELLLEAGLLTRNPETGRVYDRFRNRLTVEIRDARGEVLGFGARALTDDQLPKYLNSPESARFSKGKLLYGLDRAKESIRASSAVFLVEGYFDRIAMEKAGLGNAVASMGTSLTAAQADLLARHAATVTVAYDGDAPGLAAAMKVFPMLVERGVSVRHLVFPERHDPDSFLAAHGAEALRSEAARSLSLVASLIRTIPASGGDPVERGARAGEAVAVLAAAPDRIVRYELLSALSSGTGIPLQVLIPREGKKKEPRAVETSGAAPPDTLPGGEERVLSTLLSEWPESAPLIERIPVDLFVHPTAKAILGAAKRLDPKARTLDFSDLESHLEGGAGSVAARLLFGRPERDNDERDGGQVEGGPDGRDVPGGGRGLLSIHKDLLQLKIRHLEERGSTLQREILAATSSGDPNSLGELQREKLLVVAEVRRLKDELRGRSKS